MRYFIKNITIVIIMIVILMGFTNTAHASMLIINNIEVLDFLPQTQLYSADDTYSVTTNTAFSIDYAPDTQRFQIIVLSAPYEENRALAEKTFVEKLAITKAESCYMPVSIVAPAYVTDKPDSQKLDHCTDEKKADINSDGTVNAFDYAICLDEMIADPSPAKLQCDLNVNRRIDASDLSIVITYIKKSPK